MRKYTQGLVRLGFDLICAEDIGNSDVFLVYFHWEDGCLLTLESRNGDDSIHKIVLYYIWRPDIKNKWAFSVIDFGTQDPAGDFRSERHHSAGPYFAGGQVMLSSIELLEDKLDMLRFRGELLLPWPEQPILKLCPDKYLVQCVTLNERTNKLRDITSTTFARFHTGIRAVLSPQ